MTRPRPSLLAFLLILAGAAPFTDRTPKRSAAQTNQAASRDQCAAPANKVVAENCRAGNAREEWDVNGRATDDSVDVENPGRGVTVSYGGERTTR